jgi:protein O-mannosyl-transferase
VDLPSIRRGGPWAVAAPWLSLALVLALTLAAYWRVLPGEFQFDDFPAVVRNLGIKDLRALARGPWLASLLRGGRPATELSFALDYAAGGLEPWRFHLTSLVIHLAAVLLAFAFGRALLSLAGVERADGVALAAAGLFALHPLQTEAVSYVAQRSETLASGLYLAALLWLLRADRRGQDRWTTLAWLGAASAFILGLAAKPIVVTLPVAWLLIAWLAPAPAARPTMLPWPIRLAAAAPMLALGAVQAAFSVSWVQSQAPGYGTGGLTPLQYLLVQCRALPVYLRLLAWPAGQRVDWAFHPAGSLEDPTTLAAAGLLVIVLAGAALVGWRARGSAGPGAAAARAGSTGVLLFFVVLSVTSSVLPIPDALVEHRVYLASLGPFLAAALAAERVLARWKLAARGGPVVALAAWLALAAATYQRNGAWETRRGLWSDAVRKGPGSPVAWLALGHAALLESDLPGAVEASRSGLAVAAEDRAARLQLLRNLSTALLRAGRLDEAEVALRQALGLKVDDPDSLNNLAVVMGLGGRLEEAERFARRATEAAPERGEGWNTLGDLLLLRGDPAGALAAVERSLSLDPDVPARRINRARALAALGRTSDACSSLSGLRPGDGGGIELASLQRELGCSYPSP